MKRTKIVATVSTGILCLALLIVGVWAAVVANFSINTKLTFNPNGVYVELSGQIYRGASYSELEPLLDDPSYTLQPCKNYTTEEAVDGTSTSTTYSISSWNPEEVLFLPTEKVVQFELNVTNKGDKQISVVPTNDVEIEGVTVLEEASGTLAIPAGKTRAYRITLTAGTTELKSVPFELKLDIVNTEDIENPASDFTMNSSTATELKMVNSGYQNPVYSDNRILVVPDTINGNRVLTTTGRFGEYDCTFSNLGKTKYVVLPKFLTSFGGYDFLNNKKINSLYLPSELTDDQMYGVFDSCTSLEITVDEENESISSVNGSLYNKDKTSLLWHANREVINDIPDSVLVVGGYAFSPCVSLIKITFPEALSMIKYCAFQSTEGGGVVCKSLISVYMTGNAPAIATDVFGFVWSNNWTSTSTLPLINEEFKIYVKVEYLDSYQEGLNGFNDVAWSSRPGTDSMVEYWYYYSSKITTY